MGCLFLLQGIFQTQGSNPPLCLLPCQKDSLPLSHLGSLCWANYSPLKVAIFPGGSRGEHLEENVPRGKCSPGSLPLP